MLSVGALCKLFAISVALTLALASAALADQVTNRIDTSVDTAPETLTLNEGEGQDVPFRVEAVSGDGDNNNSPCNVDAGESLTVEVLSDATSVATVSSQPPPFTACNQDQSATVAAGAGGTATVTVRQASGSGSNTTGSGTYNYAPATFTVTVNNVPPTISDILDQTTDEDTSTGAIPFTVGDAGTPPRATLR